MAIAKNLLIVFITDRVPKNGLHKFRVMNRQNQDIKGVVFSSGRNEHLASLLVSALNGEFRREAWDHWRSLFSSDTAILNQFLKRLLVIDAAVLLLTDDDITSLRPGNEVKDIQLLTPRDNVIFEVGAVMARVGLKRTFIVAPDLDLKDFRILDYLSKFDILRYPTDEAMVDDRLREIASDITRRLGAIGEDVYHSDLPAIGLCYGYVFNFLRPVLRCLADSQTLTFSDKPARKWRPEYGFQITLVIPRALWGRKDAERELAKFGNLQSTSLTFQDGRNPGVFIEAYTEGKPLHVIDIPTTLYTSENVIERVVGYWAEHGEQSDPDFRQSLVHREIQAFRRQLELIFRKDDQIAKNVRLVDVEQLPALLGE